MYNIFEEAVLPHCPIAQMYKVKLEEYGAIRSMMSGSGSAVFGIFANEQAAIHAKNNLDKEGIEAYVCRPE